jgi:hypothetical protein
MVNLMQWASIMTRRDEKPNQFIKLDQKAGAINHFVYHLEPVF